MASLQDPSPSEERRPTVAEFVTENRIPVMAVSGAIGLALVFGACILAYRWWNSIIGGMKVWQSAEGWHVWVCLVLLLGGLGVMFFGLQLGRSEQHRDPILRRLVYGYNAVLTGLLLLAIIVVVNVLAYIHLGRSYDWTTRSIYTLSSRSINILENLQKPTKIYAVLTRRDRSTYRKVEALLNNCRAVNDRIQVEYLSPDLDQERVNRLAEQYRFSEREGVLVVYGSEPHLDSQFISRKSLYTGSSPFPGQERDTRSFKGESELMTVLNFLEEGKQKPVIYFTQGNGELDINDNRAEEIGEGAGILKGRLETDNYTVKGLQLSEVEGVKAKNPDMVISREVPADAAIVVIAGPQQMPKHAVDALRKYLKPASSDASKKQGKLMVLVGPPDPERTHLDALETFLKEFNLQLGSDRLLSLALHFANPQVVMVSTNPELRRRNPIATAFYRWNFLFYNVRTVEPKPSNAPASSGYQAEVLLQVSPRDRVWAEKDLRTDPSKFFQADRIEATVTKLSREPLPAGVVVLESAGADFHGLSEGGEKPRLAVYGNASFVSNRWLSEPAFGRTYDLFLSTLGWLRERPGDIGIEPKKEDTYELNPGSLESGRLVLLPGLLMLVGIIGLGTGVYVVRRR